MGNRDFAQHSERPPHDESIRGNSTFVKSTIADSIKDEVRVGVFIEEGKPSSWSGVFVLHDTCSDHPLPIFQLPFFKLGGWVSATTREVKLEVCAFNNRALVRDLEEVCRNVNAGAVRLPDGRRLVVAVGERLGCQRDGPLAQTG